MLGYGLVQVNVLHVDVALRPFLHNELGVHTFGVGVGGVGGVRGVRGVQGLGFRV